MDNAPHLPDSDFVCKHADKEAKASPHAFRLHHYYEQSRASIGSDTRKLEWEHPGTRDAGDRGPGRDFIDSDAKKLE